MEYSEEIVKSYNNWMQKVSEIPDNEWEEGYRNKKRAEKRAGDKFENLCKDAGLSYITVAGELMPNRI